MKKQAVWFGVIFGGGGGIIGMSIQKEQHGAYLLLPCTVLAFDFGRFDCGPVISSEGVPCLMKTWLLVSVHIVLDLQ